MPRHASPDSGPCRSNLSLTPAYPRDSMLAMTDTHEPTELPTELPKFNARMHKEPTHCEKCGDPIMSSPPDDPTNHHAYKHVDATMEANHQVIVPYDELDPTHDPSPVNAPFALDPPETL